MTQLGINISRWFNAELRELEHILMDDERIVALVPGRYFGGYALLIATDHRVLLIDKRSFFLTLEDIRYDMISEVDFSARMFDSTLQIYTFNKQHRFTSVKHKKHLRTLTVYVQQQIMQLKQKMQNQTPALAAFQPSAQASVAPIREVYPTRAVPIAHPYMRFAAPVRNFKKVGAAALISAYKSHHRAAPHLSVPHPHLPHLPQPHNGIQPSPLYQYQQAP
jgi:hypothetical protein